MMSFMKKKRFKFHVDFELVDLSDVPLVNAVLFAKIRLLDGGSFVDTSRRMEVSNHRVSWNHRFEFVCRIASDPNTFVLEPCPCRLSIRKECKGGKAYQKLGFADVNLSEFAGSGIAGLGRSYLLDGYDRQNRQRQDNSRLSVKVTMTHQSADPCFKVPALGPMSGVNRRLWLGADDVQEVNPADRKAPYVSQKEEEQKQQSSQPVVSKQSNSSSSSNETAEIISPLQKLPQSSTSRTPSSSVPSSFSKISLENVQQESNKLSGEQHQTKTCRRSSLNDVPWLHNNEQLDQLSNLHITPLQMASGSRKKQNGSARQGHAKNNAVCQHQSLPRNFNGTSCDSALKEEMDEKRHSNPQARNLLATDYNNSPLTTMSGSKKSNNKRIEATRVDAEQFVESMLRETIGGHSQAASNLPEDESENAGLALYVSREGKEAVVATNSTYHSAAYIRVQFTEPNTDAS